MVLGDGAREQGAVCDRIPASMQGTGYVRIDGVREPTRVRAGYVTDPDIAAMVARLRRHPAPAWTASSSSKPPSTTSTREVIELPTAAQGRAGGRRRSGRRHDRPAVAGGDGRRHRAVRRLRRRAARRGRLRDRGDDRARLARRPGRAGVSLLRRHRRQRGRGRDRSGCDRSRRAPGAACRRSARSRSSQRSTAGSSRCDPVIGNRGAYQAFVRAAIFVPVCDEHRHITIGQLPPVAVPRQRTATGVQQLALFPATARRAAPARDLPPDRPMTPARPGGCVAGRRRSTG